MNPKPPLATVLGKVHGKNIVLEEPLDLPDGQTVILEVRLPPGDGLRLSAGGWADAGPDLEETLREIYRWRHLPRGGRQP